MKEHGYTVVPTMSAMSHNLDEGRRPLTSGKDEEERRVEQIQRLVRQELHTRVSFNSEHMATQAHTTVIVRIVKMLRQSTSA
jgi:hypothetical protein